ncbi:hypothetical protein Sjap_000071 [Stephania japonica]|uniref:Uncharacterized protein n=1 Tax=Stephania japonica TaxID=461633 RepID=A0AAP0PTN9_9MAGN
MAKSQRSKREKRLRSIRREIADPFHEKKETAKLSAQAAALAAPKLPVRSQNTSNNSMEIATATDINKNSLSMDVDMTEGGSTYDHSSKSLKAVGGVGKKMKKKLKIGKGKRRGKGKIRRKHI